MEPVTVIVSEGIKEIRPPTSKPHLICIGSRWCCVVDRKVGLGKDPVSAYLDSGHMEMVFFCENILGRPLLPYQRRFLTTFLIKKGMS